MNKILEKQQEVANNKDEKQAERLYPEQPVTCSNCGKVTEKEISLRPMNYCTYCGIRFTP